MQDSLVTELGVQCKLDVGSVNDPAEREADEVAESVMRILRGEATPSAPIGATTTRIRRMARSSRGVGSGGDVKAGNVTRVHRALAAPEIGHDGGVVSAALEGRIRRSQTGGTPLDRDTREKVEGAFGVGFSDVRIHRDSSIAPQIGAAAFTHGRHIHFAPGHYDTRSERGQRLLSHELTHVVQQSGSTENAIETESPSPAITRSSGRPLRRKVGFEFETAIRVGTKDWIGNGFTGLDYQDLIFTSNSRHWKIVADSSNMEFVTEPFTENPAGRALLVTAMTEITNWAANIPGVVTAAANTGHPGTGRVDAVDPTAGTTSTGDMFKPILIVLNALADAGILAAPQATGGVRLDQIPGLIDQMLATTITANEPAARGGRLQAGLANTNADLINAAARGDITDQQRDDLIAQNTKLRNYQAQTGVTAQNFASSLVAMNIDDAAMLAESKTLATTAVNNLHPVQNCDKLKGLLTIVVCYILVGHRDPVVMEYSKLIAPLMARTNFYSMYRLLAQHEKALFTENFVLTTAGLAGTGAAHMFTAGFDNDGAVDHGPTRSAWIDSIIQGSPGIFGRRISADLLSQGSGSTAADNSSSLGSMQRPDTRTDQHGHQGAQDLAVLELRRLPKKVQRLEWSQMALDIFDMIVALP